MDNQEDARLYHRFSVNHPDLCYVTHNQSLLGYVTEISYGGFSLDLNRKTNSNKTQCDLVEFHFLDKSIQCEVEERYSRNNKAGYRLKHEQTKVLTFLKEIIPWIRAGAALSCLQKLELDGFEAELPEHLNFEGPIPIEIEWLGVDLKKSPNFSMTFTQDKVVYQLIKNNDLLETLHNVWPGGESGELRKTSILDTTILRNGLAILIGMANYNESSTYNQIVNNLLNIYKRSTQSITNPVKKAS